MSKRWQHASKAKPCTTSNSSKAAADANAIEPSVVLIALEEMLGVDCGGENLGEALEHWLSLPPKKRKPMQFAELKKKWDAQEQEMLAMVERNLANLP